MNAIEQAKQKANEYIDMRMVASVIAAGALLTGAVFALRKVGFKKVAAVVSKAK